MCSVNRVWTALLLLATIVVAGAVGYVLVHNDKVPQAGQTPGFSAPAPKPSGSGGLSGSSGPSGSTSKSGSGSASTSTDPSSVHITFLGDNWTTGAGVGHDAAKAFPALVTAALKVKDSVVAEDGSGYAKRGPGGDSYNDLVTKVVDSKPDIVVVSGGRNDVSDDVNTLKDAAKQLFSSLKSKLPDAQLVAVAPFWGDSTHPSDLGKVDDAVQAGVEAAGGTYLDIPDPLKDHKDWMSDDANPGEKGCHAIADALQPELKKLL
jgi:lysophospholipase L1-like esterase